MRCSPLNHLQHRATLLGEQMHPSGDPRQVAVGNVFQVKRGQRVHQIPHHGETMGRTAGQIAQRGLGVEVENGLVGVVGVDGGKAREWLVNLNRP